MRLSYILRKAQQATSPPLYVLPQARGGAPYKEWTTKVIRFVRHGCANRPFFHIAVQEADQEQYGSVIEQVGTYDPFPNKHNEKLVALNLIRIQHWLDEGAIMSLPVKKLLGLAGYFPIHPITLKQAWMRRKLLMDTLAELEAAAAEARSKTESSPSESESPENPT